MPRKPIREYRQHVTQTPTADIREWRRLCRLEAEQDIARLVARIDRGDIEGGDPMRAVLDSL